MRPFPVFAVLLAVCIPLHADPPANDDFASRISLAGSAVDVTEDATNFEATEEPNENTRNGYFGSTVWWSWIAPSSGWVRVDTTGSDFDTVVQISTGSTAAGQTVVAFNDQEPGGVDVSRIHFMAVAGTVYNISVGGWDDQSGFGAYEGEIDLHIRTGSEAVPAYFPTSLTFTPAVADVTGGPVNVSAEFIIQGKTGGGSGFAGLGLGWEKPGSRREFMGRPAFWNAGVPQSGSPRISFTVPRYTPGGAHHVWLTIIPDDGSEPLSFTGPDGGSGYALPPAPAAMPVLQVISSCPPVPTDQAAPHLAAFSITPDNAVVTSTPAALQISATVTDDGSGVGAVNVTLLSGTDVSNLVVPLTLSSGTVQNGTWTGTVMVPALYPTGNYSVLIESTDIECNVSRFGQAGNRDIPGAHDGIIDVPVIGGGAYETWAWTWRFAPDDPKPGLLDDANGDGLPNLLSYAFNLDPHKPAISAGFLPRVEMTGAGASRRLRITFLRRKMTTNSGITYSPQFTNSLSGVWQSVAGGTVTSVSPAWEQVVIDDTVTVSAEARRFARVKVEYDAP